MTALSTVEIADYEWHEELDGIVEFGKDRLDYANDPEVFFASLAGALGLINFHQFGRMPSHSHRKEVTLRHPSNWKFNQFRSVRYV